jgi:hypothetical protein
MEIGYFFAGLLALEIGYFCAGLPTLDCVRRKIA